MLSTLDVLRCLLVKNIKSGSVVTFVIELGVKVCVKKWSRWICFCYIMFFGGEYQWNPLSKSGLLVDETSSSYVQQTPCMFRDFLNGALSLLCLGIAAFSFGTLYIMTSRA
jgi:hypothetical protein